MVPGLARHPHRVVCGGGQYKASLGKVDLEPILTNFAPLSKQRDRQPDLPQDHEIDLLIATDCISEGQNLQDRDLLINYDIHWNPVRIIQRFGRIDRIGSRNPSVSLVIFCLRQRDNKRPTEVNPLAPYYLVYVLDDGNVCLMFMQPKQALGLFRALAANHASALTDLCDSFDHLDHNWLVKMLEIRIADCALIRVIVQDWRNSRTGSRRKGAPRSRTSSPPSDASCKATGTTMASLASHTKPLGSRSMRKVCSSNGSIVAASAKASQGPPSGSRGSAGRSRRRKSSRSHGPDKLDKASKALYENVQQQKSKHDRSSTCAHFRGARCGNSARRDLREGRRATDVSTLIIAVDPDGFSSVGETIGVMPDRGQRIS
jgi:superfamily II DNA/RNA helicase